MTTPRYQDYFSGKDFNERRGCIGSWAGGSGGCNAQDPNGLFTYGELQAGYTATNSFRDFSPEDYALAITGELSTEAIQYLGPRIKMNDPARIPYAMEDRASDKAVAFLLGKGYIGRQEFRAFHNLG